MFLVLNSRFSDTKCQFTRNCARNTTYLSWVVNGVNDLKRSDFKDLCIERAHEGTTTGNGFVSVEGSAWVHLEHFFDEWLEFRNPRGAAENLDAVEGPAHEPRPLNEPDKTVPDSIEQISANLFEFFTAYLRVQVEVVGQAFNDDRKNVSICGHLALRLLGNVQQLGEDFGMSFRRQAHPFRSMLRVEGVHEISRQPIIKESASNGPISLCRQNLQSIARKGDKT